jgi:hypothetical protein
VRTGFERRDGLLAISAYAAIVVALPLVPRFIPASTYGISAAAASGYNTSAAFWTVAVWALAVLILFASRARIPGTPIPTAEGAHDPGGARPDFRHGRLRPLELATVFVLFALAYCPLFLARYAPYSEDMYFLTALWRMACGDRPYRDFGFLYGPSAIYPLWEWFRMLGASVLSYFAFLALLEGAIFAALAAVLQRLVPERRERYLVFLLFLPFVFNNLFGLNYSALRWLVPTFALLFAALRPWDRRTAAVCALLLGFHLTYSHEYALAGLTAIIVLQCTLWWQQRRAVQLQAASIVVVGTLVTWAVVAGLLLGDTFSAYLRHAGEIVRMMNSGHAGFRFYWTANSLALFGVLTLACAVAGSQVGARRLDAAGRLLLAAVIFALVALRSGLTRADLWHLNPPFVPLLLAFLLPFSVRALPAPIHRRAALSLAAAASLTFAIGIAPMLSLYVSSYLNGVRATIAGLPLRPHITALDAGIERERATPVADLLALGAFLRSIEPPPQRALFYGRTWAISARVGVCPAGYKLDDLMYSEVAHPERKYLEAHPETPVVMTRKEFTLLFEPPDPSVPHSSLALTPMKQLGRWLSTVHYDQSETETRLIDEARAGLTGGYLRTTYRPAASFGDYVVLERR